LGAAAKAQVPINVTAGTEIDSSKPHVAFNTAVKTFFVVWQEEFGDVRGRTVSDRGVLGPMRRIFDASSIRSLRYDTKFEDASVVYVQDRKTAAGGEYFVVARMIQTERFGRGREFVEIVGRRLDNDGKPVSGVVRLSQTGLGASRSLPASFLGGKPDIAAPATNDIAAPLVVWSEADTVRGAYWPASGRGNPFPVILAKSGGAIPSPAVAFDPNGGDGRYLTAFPLETRRGRSAIAIAETPAGSTRAVPFKVIAEGVRPRPPGGFGPILRNDVDIAVGAKTIDVVFYEGGGINRGISSGRSLAPDLSTLEKIRSLPRIAAGHVSFEFPTTTAFGEGFASGYDLNAFGGNFAGLSLAAADGRWLAGVSVPRPASLPRFGSIIDRPTVAAFEGAGIVAFAWSNRNPPAQMVERNVWVAMMTPPRP
ncbi:MAG: hypothetical protein AAFP78_06930, partial [Pseudomonadota bacterium]